MKKVSVTILVAILLVFSISMDTRAATDRIGLGFTMALNRDFKSFGVLGIVPIYDNLSLVGALSNTNTIFSGTEFGLDWCTQRLFKNTDLGLLGRIAVVEGLGKSLTGYVAGGWVKTYIWSSVNPLGMNINSYLSFNVSYIFIPETKTNSTRINVGLFDEIGENLFWDFKLGKNSEDNKIIIYSCFGIYLPTK